MEQPVLEKSVEYVNVVFPLPIRHAFTYLLPAELHASAKIGCRVIAPFGARRLTGFIVGSPDETHLSDLKEIQDVLDPEPVFSPEMLRLAEWVSGYYLCSLGEALKAMLPAALVQASRQYVELIRDHPRQTAAGIEAMSSRQAQILRYLEKAGKMSVSHLKTRIGARSLVCSLNKLEVDGFVQVRQSLTSRSEKPRVELYVALSPNHELACTDALTTLERKAPKQAACVQCLRELGRPVLQKELLRRSGASLQTLKSLRKKGLVTFTEKKIFRDYYDFMHDVEPEVIELNEEQRAALEEIEPVLHDHQFETFLLFGVTGSGKTQVYIEAIKKTLAMGKDAIVLVPEISLTPQTVRRFRSHFKDKVAVLHSAMSDGERLDSWRKIKDGRARVVIGPRSAVFAPLRNIGLIVVDEEHEASYKQTDSVPRYNARDVAIVRAKSANAVVVLGSATPSAESFYNTQVKKFRLLELQRRVNDVALPEVRILDMLKEKRLSGKREEPVFSRLLAKKIAEKVERNEQIILLLNRRGFSSYIKCHDCGHVEECEHCNITLTYHLHGRRLRCHYCGFSKRAPEVCAACASADILFRGLGTQKVEEALQSRFPGLRTVRMDLDTTSQKRSHDRILQDFGDGKFDVLLGTQMVAKGLDFSRVTLVGVINADIGMLVPDFRSTERTFQLLTQVAGRAGRKDLTGEVIIQTYTPDSFCLHCAQTHDFIRFFAGEILERRELLYPPFGRLVCIHFRGEDEQEVRRAAAGFATILKSRQGSFQILGPTPSPIERIQNKYRYQILLKADKSRDAGGKKIRQAVEQAQERFGQESRRSGVRVTVDVDPISII